MFLFSVWKLQARIEQLIFCCACDYSEDHALGNLLVLGSDMQIEFTNFFSLKIYLFLKQYWNDIYEKIIQLMTKQALIDIARI